MNNLPPKLPMMEPSSTYFYHGETVDGYRFTIAGRFQTMIENDADLDGPDIIRLGISLCSKQDHYAKKLGRIRSEGRMKSKNIHGQSYYSLYEEEKPVRWFEGQEHKVFTEAAALNSALTRDKLMRKFNL